MTRPDLEGPDHSIRRPCVRSLLSWRPPKLALREQPVRAVEEPLKPNTYRESPLDSSELPPGIPYIVSNEAAERFSFYGMKAILVVFMTTALLDRTGAPAPMEEGEARAWYHAFNAAVYFTPLAGALLADVFLGKYRTILSLSLFYCLGHLCLALDETRLGLLLGLSLIALGAGGIKPCVSAHVGDQFGERNQHRLPGVFGAFYFAINLGSFVATLLIPWLLATWGSAVAFGLPGVLMALATFIFWLGRDRFVHIPARGMAVWREIVSAEGRDALGRLVGIYLFVAVFWALYDQTGSSWVLQGTRMNLHALGVSWLPSQVQALNPVLILLLVPLFTAVLYPWIGRLMPFGALRRIGLGFWLTALAFAWSAGLETVIAAGQTPNIAWQLPAWILITAGEVLVSVTCLEFSYTQAPRTLKSLVMALFFLSISLGNLLVAAINFLLLDEHGASRLANREYFWFFALLMAAAALLFVPVARRFQGRTYLQTSESA
ncbi:MAG: POT family MFS transporter [Candidatus Delongbacteria bacterium]|nr:POT family MFS transporter [Candidatus Delongbacteria bacterium]